MKKYFNIYKHFVKNSIIAQMEFKSNFIVAICTEFGYLFAKSLYIIVLFSAGLSINGLTPEQMLMFIGSYTLITGFMDAVYLQNIVSIQEYVRMATLDTYLTKPVNSMFIVTLRKFDLGLGIPNVIAGLIMIVVSWIKSNAPVTAAGIAGYVFLTVLGCALTYPILFIPALVSFWTVKSDALQDAIWALWDFNNMPMTIYNKKIRAFGIFVFPVFIITNFAPMWVFGILPTSYILYAILSIPIFFGLMIFIWRRALRHYSSASS